MNKKIKNLEPLFPIAQELEPSVFSKLLTLNLSSFFLRDVPSTEADPISSTRTGAVEVAGGEGEEDEEEATIDNVFFSFGLLDAASLDDESAIKVRLGACARRAAAELELARAGAVAPPDRTGEVRIMIEEEEREREKEKDEKRTLSQSRFVKRRCFFFLRFFFFAVQFFHPSASYSL